MFCFFGFEKSIFFLHRCFCRHRALTESSRKYSAVLLFLDRSRCLYAPTRRARFFPYRFFWNRVSSKTRNKHHACSLHAVTQTKQIHFRSVNPFHDNVSCMRCAEECKMQEKNRRTKTSCPGGQPFKCLPYACRARDSCEVRLRSCFIIRFRLNGTRVFSSEFSPRDINAI